MKAEQGKNKFDEHLVIQCMFQTPLCIYSANIAQTFEVK